MESGNVNDVTRPVTETSAGNSEKTPYTEEERGSEKFPDELTLAFNPDRHTR